MNAVEEMCKSYIGLSYIREIQKNDSIITLPVLDRLNDWLSIRVSIAGNTCRISDMGFVIDDLQAAGITYIPDGNAKFDVMIDTITRNLMCRYDENSNELYTECLKEKLGDTIMYFLQAISHIDFLAYNTQGFVSSNHVHFRFTVASYFRSRGCSDFRESPSFRGGKGRQYTFGFSMPNSTIVDLLSENIANNKYAIMYKWDDARKGELQNYSNPLFVIENYEKSDRHKDIDEAMDEDMITRLAWADKRLIDRYVIGL